MSNKAKKLKVLKEKDHIQKKRENEYITFSFKYITTNKRYNLKSLDSDKNKKIEAYTKLIEKILEIEKMDWLVFY